MLRTFCSNPGLGGFGNESTIRSTNHNTNDTIVVTPDAFCQIIKELVDNAVDACTAGTSIVKTTRSENSKPASKQESSSCADISETTTAKRVRVVIERFMEHKDVIDENDHDKELLKVTVSDNGCGMNDIQECVGAFHTSKADYSTDTNAKSVTPDHTQQTAGRYGIGLTLCLLHAQRLVPDSCASIQSATSEDHEWKVVSVVVDTASDIVRCLPRTGIPKSTPNQSGTAVSILVPGGPSAIIAWPRLAEYFARFNLSLDMTCSLEVLAPTLSRVPLWVHPNDAGPVVSATCESMKGGKKCATKCNCTNLQNKGVVFNTTLKGGNIKREREQIWKATQIFLGRTIDLANVAHTSVPIRMENKITNKKTVKTHPLKGPRLVVAVVVQSRNLIDGDGMDKGSNEINEEEGNKAYIEDSLDTEAIASKSASMVLIRMVNKIPLLDSAEATACGLIYGLASKKKMWNSFGLDVNMNIDPGNINAIPSFDVRDSDQVMPFFNQGAHNLLEYDSESDADDDTDPMPAGIKRKRHRSSRRLLPASLRLGNILLIVQIHAEPATLPLPTLCKGRLPIGNKSIDDALEIGITQCLQQLQKTNPNLLLTAAELRKAECDARYVPAVALALATILSNATKDTDESCVESIRNWDVSDSVSSKSFHSAERKTSVGMNVDHTSILSLLIERRLRLVMTQSQKGNNASKDSNPNFAENANATLTVATSTFDVDCASKFRDGDLLTDYIALEGNGHEQEFKRTVDEDCDFDVWL